MRDELRELWRYRELILILVRRDLRVRYKNSALGFFWSLLPLLLQAAVTSIVVKFIYRIGSGDLGPYILAAYIPWNFIQNGLLDGSVSVLSQYGLLKKVYFPREVLPIATVIGNAVHMALAMGVFFVIRYVFTTLLFGWPSGTPREILWLPVLLLITFVLVLGLVFFLSALNVFHEDIKFIAQTILQLSFFALPIAWFTKQIALSPRLMAWHLTKPLTILYNANPVSWLISAFKQILLPPAKVTDLSGHLFPTDPLDYRYFALAFISSLFIVIAGYHYFNKRKWDFTERP